MYYHRFYEHICVRFNIFIIYKFDTFGCCITTTMNYSICKFQPNHASQLLATQFISYFAKKTPRRSTVLQHNSHRFEVVRASLCKVLFINTDGIIIGWLEFSKELFAGLCITAKTYSPPDYLEYFRQCCNSARVYHHPLYCKSQNIVNIQNSFLH